MDARARSKGWSTLSDKEKKNPLGATLSKNASRVANIRQSITAATPAMVKMNRLWNSRTISFEIKFKLCRSLVAFFLLYGCEAWADKDRRIQTLEMKCFQRLLRIPSRKQKTIEFVRNAVTTQVGSQESQLTIVKQRQLIWFMSLDMTHCSRDSSKGCVWRITTGETGDVVVEHQGVDRSPVGDLLNWRRIGQFFCVSSWHPLPTFDWSQLRDRSQIKHNILLAL